MKFRFRHMKTPSWAKRETDIYFLVLDENHNNYAYIGLQDVDFTAGVCGNLCYKTSKRFRGGGLSKEYLKQFFDSCPFEIDIYKASVKKDNIASIKMLEYCGFDRLPEKTEKTKSELEEKRKELEEVKDKLAKREKEKKEDSDKVKKTSKVVTNTTAFDYTKFNLETKRNTLNREVADLEKKLAKEESDFYRYRLRRFDF